MSLPRRTPPSQMISMRPPTASATGATRSNAAGAPSSWRPPWFDSAMASTPRVGGEHRVVDGLDALDDDRAVPHRAQPVDVGPRQRRVELGVDVVGQRDRRGAVADLAADDVGEADRLAAHERPRPAGVERAVDDRAGPDRRRQREAAAHVALAPAEHGGVDGEHERLVARGGGAVDHLLDEPAVAPGVDLEPQAAVADRPDLFDRAGAERRQRVREPGARRRRGRRRARRRGRRCG